MKLAYTVPVVVAIAFALLRRVAPYNSPEHTSAGSLKELRTKYAKWEAAGFVPFVLFAVVWDMPGINFFSGSPLR